MRGWFRRRGGRRRRKAGDGPRWRVIVTWAVVLLGVLSAYRYAFAASYTQSEILDAIRMVESGGRAAPPDGDGGRAIGPYQIHRVYWEDAVASEPELGAAAGNRYQDCRDRGYAERIVAAYMRRYAPEAWASCDAETIARIHNGGPTGPRKAATRGYWERVERALEGESR